MNSQRPFARAVCFKKQFITVCIVFRVSPKSVHSRHALLEFYRAFVFSKRTAQGTSVSMRLLIEIVVAGEIVRESLKKCSSLESLNTTDRGQPSDKFNGGNFSRVQAPSYRRNTADNMEPGKILKRQSNATCFCKTAPLFISCFNSEARRS